jgi:hypothetical protein
MPQGGDGDGANMMAGNQDPRPHAELLAGRSLHETYQQRAKPLLPDDSGSNDPTLLMTRSSTERAIKWTPK